MMSEVVVDTQPGRELLVTGNTPLSRQRTSVLPLSCTKLQLVAP
jgi:hypothetical protein